MNTTSGKSDRDTHFQHFAELLWDELHTLSGHEGERYEMIDKEIIARWAYDLVCYASQFMPGIENVPDISARQDILPEGYDAS